MYRIITEDIRRGRILDIVSAHTKGATVYPATGLWQGRLENSLVIELAIKRKKAYAIAKAIKKETGQDAVLVQYVNDTVKLI